MRPTSDQFELALRQGYVNGDVTVVLAREGNAEVPVGFNRGDFTPHPVVLVRDDITDAVAITDLRHFEFPLFMSEWYSKNSGENVLQITVRWKNGKGEGQDGVTNYGALWIQRFLPALNDSI